MASTAKNIMGIVPGLQATALVALNIPDSADFEPKKRKSKDQTKKIVKKGVTTLIGIGLMGPTASMINKMS